MNMSKKTRISVLLTSVTIALFSVLVATSNNVTKSKAAESAEDSYEQYLPVIEQLAEEVSVELAESQLDNINISVKDTTPIYNVTDNIVGYSVALESNNIDYGYVNLDFTTDQLVTDYSISEDADSIYTELSEDFVEANSDVSIDDVNNKIYGTNGIDYAVSANVEGKELFFYGAETFTSDDFEEVLDHYEENYLEYYDNIEYEDNFYYGIPDEAEDKGSIIKDKICKWFKKWIKKLFPGFFDNDDNDDSEDYVEIIPTAYPTHSEVLKKSSLIDGELAPAVMIPQYSLEKSLVSQETIMTTTKRYACGLVALTGICSQEDIMLNNSIQDTFNKLWDITGAQKNIYQTISNYGIDGIDCSSTTVYNMGLGMRKYGEKVGATITTNTKARPTIDFYKNCVNNGNSSVLCYQIAKKGGHGVSILGYTTATIGKQTFDYIVAADGWYDDAPRYVMYYPELFQSTTGIEYDITK